MNQSRKLFGILSYIRIIIAGFIFSIISICCIARDVTVFVRVDDIFMLKSPLEPMEIEGFLQVAEKHKAKAVLAAIPNRLLQPVNKDGAMSRAILDMVARGHQIVQHGYDHRCAFTGVTDREFCSDAALQKMTQKERIDKILEGRKLLEAVLGLKMTAYVGPGADDLSLLEKDAPLLYSAGFTWVQNAPASTPVIRKEGCSFAVIPDFVWDLNEENYAERIKSQKEYCMKSIEEGNTCCLKFHDHFTRKAYKNGIALRFLDEMLTWLESNPEWKIKYQTLDEYYSEKKI